MRFSVTILFLSVSILYSQTKIFIKYKSEQILKLEIEPLQKLITANNSFSLQKSNSASKVIQFKEKYGNLNNSLNNVVQIIIDDERKNFIIDSLKNNFNIEYFQIAQNYKIDEIPQDSLYEKQWGLQAINAEAAWNLLPAEKKKVLLAVIDTGIDFFNPEISNVIFKNEGEIGLDKNGNNKMDNGVDDDGNGFIDDYQGWDFVNKLDIYQAELEDDFTEWDNYPMDENGHGTNVSGIIGAEHNKSGIAGVSDNVSILNLRAFDKNGSGEEDDAVSAIIYAVKMGAKVINMSWGDGKYSYLLQDVIKYAHNNGVVMIGSSGNSGSDLPHYPSGFKEVISVGATQKGNSVAGFSNYGSTLDLVAPGSQILTLALNNEYKTVSGTSASAPFVSAAASILLSYNNFNFQEIKQILKSTATDIELQGWDNKSGAGLLNLEKAVRILSPSLIEINEPAQDFYTFADSLKINISCLTSSFKDYTLFWGKGVNPTEWNRINLEDETYQLYKENVKVLNIKNFDDTTYTLRLLVNQIDNKTLEERVNFIVDRTAPKVIAYNYFPALINDKETMQATVITDEPTIVKLFYRKKNTNDEFKEIILDGFINNYKLLDDKHFGFLPLEEVQLGLNHEFYFEILNGSGLSSTLKDNNSLFEIKNSITKSVVESSKKDYQLPLGRIYNGLVNFAGVANNFIALNKNDSPTNLTLYEFNGNDFTERKKLEKRILIDCGDFNNDSKTDLLSLFVKNAFIETQTTNGQLNLETVFADTSGNFWAAYTGDIDSDGKFELISFANDTTTSIWEVGSRLNLSREQDLFNFANKVEGEKTIFNNNSVLIGDFDSDSKKEIAVMDNYGRILLYEIINENNYQNDAVIEHFAIVESNNEFTKGDFNNDGILDIAVLMKLENGNDLVPLTYLSVFSLVDGKIKFIFRNMFINAGDNYTSKFNKKYHQIRMADIDNQPGDELIVFNFPNSYIFNYDAGKTQLIDYKTNVNSQSIFIGDIDNNGIKDVAIPDQEKNIFYEFAKSNLILPPQIVDYYSTDTASIFLKWEQSQNSVYIYKGTDKNNLSLYDSTQNNFYIDENIELNKNYFYSFQFYSEIFDTILSPKSNVTTVYSHLPAKLVKVEAKTKNSIELTFTDKIKLLDNSLKVFLLNSLTYPNSVVASSEFSKLLTFEKIIQNGNHQISIENIRDFYNSPIKDTSLSFNVNFQDLANKKLFIEKFEVIDNNNLVVHFNFPLESNSALAPSNYIFFPENRVVDVKFLENSNNSIIIKSKKPFGSIGKEYKLKVINVISTDETGALSISEGAGSEIVISSTAENLDDIYVYPNPINQSNYSKITFANLTSHTDIYIFTIDGMFVKKLEERDGNGGIDWNLIDKDGVKISSGIYFYKAIALDNLDESLQEKIGKFAVIK